MEFPLIFEADWSREDEQQANNYVLLLEETRKVCSEIPYGNPSIAITANNS
jgi:hypothetical protein